MNVRRTRAVALKEMRHITRDPRSLGMALAVPLLFLLLFGFALSLDVDHIPMLVYDADHSAESRALIQRFQASRFFTVVGFVDSYAEIEKAIDSSRVLMAIAIQRDYCAPHRRRPGSRRADSGGRQRFQHRLHRQGLRGDGGGAARARSERRRAEFQRRAKARRPSIRRCASGTTRSSNRKTTWCRG